MKGGKVEVIPEGSGNSQAAFSKAARGQILQHVELSSASRSGHSTTGGSGISHDGADTPKQRYKLPTAGAMS